MLISLFVFAMRGQMNSTTDFHTGIGSYDLNNVWMADSITDELEDATSITYKRSEPLGVIGEKHQRFYIHFSSAIRQADNPYEYFVSGKTKTGDRTCDFLGYVSVREAKLLKLGEDADHKQGYVVCEVRLYENDKQPNTGIIAGVLESHFTIDKNDKFEYKTLTGIDGFNNNLFTGTWTSYQNQKMTKNCSWGDYKNPKTGKALMDERLFGPESKYKENGWDNYYKAWSGNSSDPETQQAMEKENEEWWK